MTEQQFQSEMRRAKLKQEMAQEPFQADYWSGYIRGLRRNHHGMKFGTPEEHQLWLTLADSDDQSHAAKGRGYRDGLAIT